MSGPGPREPPQAQAGGPAGPEGADAALGEAGLSFTTTDLSLVEMTEVEYTQLQHILYSHMEAAAEGELETRLNSAFLAAGGAAAAAGGGAAAAAGGRAAAAGGAAPVYPLLCPPALADGGFAGANPCLGHIDFQELRMMLLSEAGAPPAPAAAAAAAAEKTPGADGPGAARPKAPDATGKENATAAEGAPEARAKSAVRVRLEDRFNSIPAEPPPAPRGAEPPEPGVALNNLVTLIRHPSELVNVPLHQQQNKCTTLVKNKTAGAATTLQLTYPLFTANACSSGAGAGLSQTQGSGNSCSILEAAKHQDVGLPRAFSFCYQQEIESTKQTLGGRNKALPEQVWIKVGEEALCKQAINKRNRSRIRQLDASVERRALGEIQNVGEGVPAAPGPWQPASSEPSQPHPGEQAPSAPGGRSQRRERHNRMERDRRRRIRICCDELNLLVPFCNAETDKATTLQWTTAFLKYIQERHGDSLKKEFESVFCGKTGRRLKLTRPDPLAACPAQESLQSSPAMEIK
ncbi:LOW QUALITY PROTEIN: transcription factor-like 5 protein [Phyllostomus hastatus]|uniref:LOW QUALITY PROTEIN: transcription factor-like 5 protein n=1 Tax=Phyllostomus hastatus TaxID=9423 RepID=UPI001E6847FF|nr:LOW QUALITY PROTEIN: transcription factor-like 5 protein [Phyllostomus hastatus]